MMESFLLSVIVPVYNTEKYLSRCLDSILNQSYRNIEVIIVNDCSSDGSIGVIESYCAKDSRIKVVTHESNKGLFQARVTGVENANGEYIAFVDSDDYVSIDFYRSLMETATKDGIDIVAGNTVRAENGRFFQYTMHKLCFSEEKLLGENVRNTFYEQEGSCYAWHTMWNKIYSKALWDQCIPEFHKIHQHLLMTEDIAFSSVLFYYAQSFTYVADSNGYFYCFNDDASTNVQNISLKKLEKNLRDLALVFNFVEGFLLSVNADHTLCSNFRSFRKRYYLMWKRLAEKAFSSANDLKIIKPLLSELGRNVEASEDQKEYHYEFADSVWYDEIENIRRKIASEEVKTVSFDIFDTLLLRSLWNPNDIFLLMQGFFEEACPAFRNTDFKTMRAYAEQHARSEIYKTHGGYEDVTLSEIYTQLIKEFGIPEQCARKLQNYEIEMENRFLRERRVGKELFEFAKACHKTIILVSDMYLEKPVIEEILKKNGFEGYDRLFLSSQERVTKSTGRLFDRAISQMNVAASDILHIGDNWQHDICMGNQKGMQTAFLPKTKDRFCNTIAIAPTNRLASIGCMCGRQITTWDKMFSSVGYRSMMALVANKLFDNPYASWNPSTDFDINPYVMGYYAVGMHLVGVSKWLSDIVRRRKIRHISFLARDGYLPKMAFDKLRSYFNIEGVDDNYVPCSRMCLLPWMIENEQGLYVLPIEYRNHTPQSVAKLLECCYVPMSENALQKKIQNAGFSAERVFTQQEQYYKFINWFKENMFDAEQLEKSKAMTTAYYRQLIPENSLVFDLGYSGRIPAALQKCLKYPVVFAYIHHDNSNFASYRRRENLDTEVMYSYAPPFSDLVREYFLSEVGNSCIGLKSDGDHIFAEFENTEVPNAERFIEKQIKEGAMQFVHDFREAFSFVKEQMPFNEVLVSTPFEGLLHESKNEDRRVLSLVYSDDTVYGRNSQINMGEFWQGQVQRYIGCNEVHYNQQSQFSLNGKSKVEKAIIYAICDHALFKERLKARLSNHPTVFRIMKSAYKLVKRV